LREEGEEKSETYILCSNSLFLSSEVSEKMK